MDRDVLRRWLINGLAVAVLGTVIVLGWRSDASTSPPSVGSIAPEYSAPDLDGRPVSLEELRGRVVVFNIWATWCPPCRKEMPDLQALHDRYSPEGLRVIGVSVDAAGTDEAVQQFLEEYGVTYTILRDPSDRISSVFMTQGVPVTILIDREGTVKWRRLGPVAADDEDLNSALTEAVRASE